MARKGGSYLIKKPGDAPVLVREPTQAPQPPQTAITEQKKEKGESK